jgi:hypothetical protein
MLRSVQFAKTRKTILSLIKKKLFKFYLFVWSTWIRLQFMSLTLYGALSPRSLKLKFPLNLSAMSENEVESFYELYPLCKRLKNVF